MHLHRSSSVLAILAVSLNLAMAQAEDWPQFGRDGTRNAVSRERRPPTSWDIGKREDTYPFRRVEESSRNIKWSARLGISTFGDPVVADGLIWVGTNNGFGPAGHPDASVLACFRESDGKLLYRYVSPRLPRGRANDWEFRSMSCSPLIDQDRLWLVTNRAEVVCLDIAPLRRGTGDPTVSWKVDLMEKFGVFPRSPIMGMAHTCSIAGYREFLYVITGNGVDESYRNVEKPEAPSLICFSRNTGEAVWQDNSPGENILDGQWSSPTIIEVDGSAQCVAAQGDGWVRAFDALTGKPIWQFDMNPKEGRFQLSRSTRNNVMAAPVFADGRIYIASGLQPEFGDQPGRLVCFDPTRRGDISSEQAVDREGKGIPHRRIQAVNPAQGEKAIPNPNSGLVWEFTHLGDGKAFTDVMHGTLSNVAVHKGLVIAPDLSGLVHCLDATTGERYWVYDSLAGIYGSPLIVDDKIYVVDLDGKMSIFGLSKDPDVALRRLNGESRPLREITMDVPVYCSPIFANGVLYVASMSELLAIAADREAPDSDLSKGYWPQWRGPNRDNVSPDTGLLRTWPEAGPPLAWRLQGLGDGIAPVSVAGGRIFATSLYETTEYVRALKEETGEPLWAAVLGPNQLQNRLMRWLTQRSPTVDDERVYGMSLLGELVCLRAHDGREVWRKNYVTDFAGKPGGIGYADCPLVEGDKLICTPGGSEASIVALDKRTGTVLWKCAVADGGRATYSNGVVGTIAGQRQFVVCLEKALVGVSVDDGNLLWRYDGAVAFTHTHTPFIRESFITCFSSQMGFKLLEVTRASGTFAVKSVSDTGRGPFALLQDDSVLLGDRLYDCTNGIFSCIDAKTGSALWRNRLHMAGCAMSYADGSFYFHATDGGVQLVEPGLTEPAVKGKFVLPDHQNAFGTTRPVVTGRRLYVREDDQLFCYDVREGGPGQPAEPRRIQLEKPATDSPILVTENERDAKPMGGYWPQWRGPNRDNVSSEKGLLKQWPAGGPPLRWRVDGIGEGIASVSIADGRIYTLGYFDGGEFLSALDQRTGQRAWATRLGPRVNENYLMRWLSQRTPTLDGDRIYAITSGGQLACLQSPNGQELWEKSYPDDFGATQPSWGFCDYPLIDGDRLICTPGGPAASLVALDKRTGQEIWRSTVPNGGRSAYAALIATEAGGVRQYIAFLGNALVGVRASDGLPLWRYEKLSSGTANSHTPIARDDLIMTSNGYGKGLALLKLAAKGGEFEVQEQYSNRLNLDAFQDNGLILGEHFFTSAGGPALYCLDWKTGERVWATHARSGKFAITSADNCLYLRTSDGELILVDASLEAYGERGRFTIPDAVKGIGATYPIIAGRRLFLRDDNKLLCYDIREDALEQPSTTPLAIELPLPTGAFGNGNRERTLRSVFVPTPQDIVEKMLEMAAVQQTDVVFDLGSGDGRIVHTAAKKYGCKAVGYELDKELVEQSRATAEAAGVKSLVIFEVKDLFTADLSGADVVAVYLLPQQLEKLLPQLETMKPGSRIVSHQFEIPPVPPDKSQRIRSEEDGQSHVVHVWTLPLPKLVRRIAWPGNHIYHTAFSPDGRLYLGGGDTGTLRIWEVASGNQVMELPVTIGCFTPDGKQILGHNLGKTISLFDVATGQELRKWEMSSPVVSLALAPTGQEVLTSHADNTVRLWYLMSGNEIRRYLGHSEPATVAFLPNGKQILTAGRDKTVLLWDADSGQLLRTFTDFRNASPVEGRDIIVQAFFLPEGGQIAGYVWGREKLLVIWNAATGAVLRKFDLGADHHKDLAISADGRWFLTGHEDRTVRLRNLKTGAELRRYKMDGVFVPRALNFSPDGQFIVAGSHRGWVNLWQIQRLSKAAP